SATARSSCRSALGRVPDRARAKRTGSLRPTRSTSRATSRCPTPPCSRRPRDRRIDRADSATAARRISAAQSSFLLPRPWAPAQQGLAQQESAEQGSVPKPASPLKGPQPEARAPNRFPSCSLPGGLNPVDLASRSYLPAARGPEHTRLALRSSTLARKSSTELRAFRYSSLLRTSASASLLAPCTGRFNRARTLTAPFGSALAQYSNTAS